MNGTVSLVVAKAPEPGRAKTRCTPPADPRQAAELAACSLLDTLDATGEAGDGLTVVAWTGELMRAARAVELSEALSRTHVIPQQGSNLGARLAAAHADVGALYPSKAVFQIGMDTPQISGELLRSCADPLHQGSGPDAVVGPATDGGWWALGLRDPRHAEVLREVGMSRPDSGERTVHALRSAGLRVALLVEISDVDTMDDAVRVAAQSRGSRFRGAVEDVCARGEDAS